MNDHPVPATRSPVPPTGPIPSRPGGSAPAGAPWLSAPATPVTPAAPGLAPYGAAGHWPATSLPAGVAPPPTSLVYPALPSAPGPAPMVTVSAEPHRRHVRATRTSNVALLVAAFVATAGVAFAIGRFSTGTTTGGQGAGPFAQLAGGASPGGQDTMRGAAFGTRGIAAAGSAAPDDGIAAPDDGIAAPVGMTSGAGGPVGGGPGSVDGGPGPDADTTLAADGGSTSVTGPGAAEAAGMAGGIPGAGGPGGFGRGVEGTIETIEDGRLTIASSDGTSSNVLVDETTTIARQEPLILDDLQVGDTVRVVAGRGAAPGPGGALGGDPTVADGSDVERPASQVIVIGEDGA